MIPPNLYKRICGVLHRLASQASFANNIAVFAFFQANIGSKKLFRRIQSMLTIHLTLNGNQEWLVCSLPCKAA